MTFSIYDLEILTDAVAFAALVTIGGVVVWLMGRRLSRGNRTDARLALASAALIAVGATGVAIRSTVGDAVPVAATIAAAPVDGRAEARPSFRPEEPTLAPDDGSSKRPDGSARTGDTADPASAVDGASAGSHADVPGSGSGSDTVAGPPSVGVGGPDEPQDDPPQQPDDPPDDPPDEDPIDAPDTDTDGDDDTDTDGNDEGSGQGPDGQGPPGQGGGGPPGQGPDGQGPPGHSGDS